MNIPVTQSGSIATASIGWESAASKAGDYVVLKALQECIVVMSACPQDIIKINDCKPVDAHFIVEDAKP